MASTAKKTLTPVEKEKFFEALENDQHLFKETLEVVLTLVISDPKLTFDVADFIESDFRNLYLVIMKKVAVERSNDSTMGCCKDI
ncbi:MAG: hypothetical protein R2830_26110 [Saprospiraceae bacterium]